MFAAILSFLGPLLQVVLKLFGYGDTASNRKKAEAEAVINEVIKYENTVDNASDIRVEQGKLDAELEEEWKKKFPPAKPL